MKVVVKVFDKEKETEFQGTVEVPSDSLIYTRTISDEHGSRMRFNLRSHNSGHLQCLLRRKLEDEDEPFTSFDMEMLKAGRKRVLFVGKSVLTWKLLKAPGGLPLPSQRIKPCLGPRGEMGLGFL